MIKNQNDCPNFDGIMKRILGLERLIADLGGRMKTTENMVDRLDADIYNHGQSGLKTTLMRFMAVNETREQERMKTLADQEQRVKERLDAHNARQTLILTVLGLAIAGLGLIEHFHL